MRHSLIAALLLCLFIPSAGHTASIDQIKDVASEMACLCGSCPRRPLDECNCGFAGQKRDEIGRMLDEGNDKEAIVAGFIARDGLQVLSGPPAEGFNLSAWIMPFAVILFGGFVIRSVVGNWARDKQARDQAASASPVPESDGDDAYRSQLESDLRNRDA